MGLMMDVKFETISRALASMAEQGLITNMSRLSVQIPSLQKLREFSQMGFKTLIDQEKSCLGSFLSISTTKLIHCSIKPS